MKNWLNNKTITKTIDEDEVQFRRIPIGTLQKFRTINEDVSVFLGMVFKDTKHDVKFENVAQPTGELDAAGNPTVTSAYTQEAAAHTVISSRNIQLVEGIKGLINAITKDESMDVLCEVIIKSAWKEEWPEDLEEFKEKMDLGSMVKFMQGALEASAGDYAELGKSWFQKNPRIKELLDQATGTE